MRLLAGVLLIVAGCEPSVPREAAPVPERAAAEGPVTPAAPVVPAENARDKAPEILARAAASLPVRDLCCAVQAAEPPATKY